MRILFLSFHLPSPDEPGASRPWSELQLMHQLGWDVVVVTASAHYLTGEIRHHVRGLIRRDVEDGVTLIRVWSPSDYRRSPVRRLACYLIYSLVAPFAGALTRHVDAVFSATDPPFMTLGAYLLARWHRAKLILDERDLYPDTALALGLAPPRLMVTVLSWWGRWLRERAASVVTVSPGLRRVLSQRGADPDRIFVIPNYFPDGRERHAIVGSLDPAAEENFVVMYAGSLGQATNVDTCLAAAAILKGRGYDRVRFIFLGSGERRAEYIAKCAHDGLTNVEFPGTVPRSEMPLWFDRIHAAVHSFPAHPYWRNALSSKILEYMAHGKPVVFAGEGDIADVLRESGGGISVPPGDAEGMADAIARLFDCPELCSRLGKNAARYIDRRFDDSSLRDVMREVFDAR